MGFLDRMVADMIKQGTGYNARGLVRRIGGRRMLMLGGAALGGALLSDQMKGGGVTSIGSGAASTSSGGVRNVAIPRSSGEAASARPSQTAPPPPRLPCLRPRRHPRPLEGWFRLPLPPPQAMPPARRMQTTTAL